MDKRQDMRGKVIRGLEKLREYADSEVHPIVSPDNWGIYSELRDLIDEAEEDALALLKAQEPVEPTLDIRHGKSMWRCGSCSTALQPNNMHAKFCFNCGKAVKWE